MIEVKRDDSGGQVMASQVGNPSEVNVRQDVNGSSNKPFPQERNFVVNPNALEDNIGKGRTEPTAPARREGAPSIYKDATRSTADDKRASAKAEASSIFECEDEKTGEEY